MRKFSIVAAVAFAMVLSSYAMAADAAKPLHGKVTAVTKDSAGAKIVSITVSSHGKAKGDPAVETVVTVDDSTKVTKEGATPTIADVTVGSPVNVTLGDGNKAVSIEIRAPKAKKPAAAAK